VQTKVIAMNRKYNELKMRALSIFVERGWLSPPAWAVLASFYPIRASYTYLRRLHRWRLLDHTLDRRGLLLYRLNRRGLNAWNGFIAKFGGTDDRSRFATWKAPHGAAQDNRCR
jgi:hypothetical protein